MYVYLLQCSNQWRIHEVGGLFSGGSLGFFFVFGIKKIIKKKEFKIEYFN